MRPIGAESYYTPAGFAPEQSSASPSRIPQTVRVSRDHRTYPSGSPQNPGYAYGTFLPLTDRGAWFSRFMFPYTVPMTANRFNTVPAIWKNDRQWINPARTLRLKGLTTVLPGVNTENLDAIQQYLGNAQG